MNIINKKQKLGVGFSLYLLILALVGLGFAYQSAEAHSDPPACSSVGVGLSITVYRADGVSPIFGTAQSGEMVNYEAELTHLGGTKCNFEGGTLLITTPDGAVHDVTPGGGIPLIVFGAPLTTSQVGYMVSEADVVGGSITASAEYIDGEAHFGTGHQTVSAYTDISTPYEDVSLEVRKTADPSYGQEYPWTIDKSVDPEEWSLFAGDTGNSEYTVAVEKGDPILTGASVMGEITIHNPAIYADALIESIVDEVSGLGVVGVDCAVDFPYLLGPDDELICSYTTDLPDLENRLNTATVTTSGDVNGGAGEAAISFDGVNPDIINASINVEDTNGESWEFFDSGEKIYEKAFNCSAVEYINGYAMYIHENTATILETDDSSSAEVTVNCYELSVEKSAEPDYSRKYNWEITKNADQTVIELEAGNIATVNYEVSVDVSGTTDMDWVVSGDIDITNPNPDRSADLLSVLDEISSYVGAVNCPAMTIAPLSTLTCTYGPIELAEGLDQLNVASVEHQNYDFGKDGAPVIGGITLYEGVADVIFGDPSMVIDESIMVTDTLGGPLGTVNFDDPLPAVFNYDYEIGPYTPEECGDYEIPNTASFISVDTQTEGSDDWLVLVNVPCVAGCTYTQGYWKTHSASGPAPYDERWGNLGDADGDGILEEEGEEFYLSGMTYLEVFNSPVKGNAYYQLAHQYMAAKLNVLIGTSAPPEVVSAIADAEALLSAYTPDDVADLKGSAKSEWTDLAGVLADYNEGAIGPGHCDGSDSETMVNTDSEMESIPVVKEDTEKKGKDKDKDTNKKEELESEDVELEVGLI